jgi:hypothetical protein
MERVSLNLQKALSTVVSWMRTNHLLLSPTKTSVHILHNPRAEVPVFPAIYLNGLRLIPSIDKFLKWLGVQFDMHLTMDVFINHTCKAAFNQLRMIRYIRSSLDRATTLLLCNSLVLSRLDYCNSLLAAATDKEINKLQRVWNLTARTVSLSKRTDHVTPLRQELGWCSARKRTYLKIIRLVYLSLCGLITGYLPCEIYVPRRQLRSSSTDVVTLKTVPSKRRIGDGAWKCIAPKIWNLLPSETRVIESFSIDAVEKLFIEN